MFSWGESAAQPAAAEAGGGAIAPPPEPECFQYLGDDAKEALVTYMRTSFTSALVSDEATEQLKKTLRDEHRLPEEHVEEVFQYFSAALGGAPPEPEQGWMDMGAAAMGTVGAVFTGGKSAWRAFSGSTRRDITPGGARCVVCGHKWVKMEIKIHCKNSVGEPDKNFGGGHLDHWFCSGKESCGAIATANWCSICSQSRDPDQALVAVRPNQDWIAQFTDDIKNMCEKTSGVELPPWVTDYTIWNTPGPFYQNLIDPNINKDMPPPEPPRFNPPQGEIRWMVYPVVGLEGAGSDLVVAGAFGESDLTDAEESESIERAWKTWSSALVTPRKRDMNLDVAGPDGPPRKVDFVGGAIFDDKDTQRMVRKQLKSGYGVDGEARKSSPPYNEVDWEKTYDGLGGETLWDKVVLRICYPRDHDRRQNGDTLPSDLNVTLAPDRLQIIPLHYTDLPHGKLVISKGSVLDFGRSMDWDPLVTAVVNAANAGGLRGGDNTIDGQFVRQGKENLKKDRRDLPILEGAEYPGYKKGTVRIRPGDAVITGPNEYGNIRASYVIHAVGPDYRGQEPGPGYAALDTLLSNAYKKTMELASVTDPPIKYLGFCLISAGIYKYRRALDNVLRIAVEAIQGSTYPGLEEVHLIAFKLDEKAALLDIMEHPGPPQDEPAEPEEEPAEPEEEPAEPEEEPAEPEPPTPAPPPARDPRRGPPASEERPMGEQGTGTYPEFVNLFGTGRDGGAPEMWERAGKVMERNAKLAAAAAM